MPIFLRRSFERASSRTLNPKISTYELVQVGGNLARQMGLICIVHKGNHTKLSAAHWFRNFHYNIRQRMCSKHEDTPMGQLWPMKYFSFSRYSSANIRIRCTEIDVDQDYERRRLYLDQDYKIFSASWVEWMDQNYNVPELGIRSTKSGTCWNWILPFANYSSRVMINLTFQKNSWIRITDFSYGSGLHHNQWKWYYSSTQ